jgi:hypothetical protein
MIYFILFYSQNNQIEENHSRLTRPLANHLVEQETTIQVPYVIQRNQSR